jgi:hypothetical protein
MRRQTDLTGQTFGELKVLRLSNKQRYGGSFLWECQCKCDKIVYARGCDLRNGHKQSCGCTRKPRVEKYAPAEDCKAWDNGCIALTETLCVTKGKCKFYKQKQE